MAETGNTAQLELYREGNLLVVTLGGDWLARPGLPSMETVEKELSRAPLPQALEFAAGDLGKWDSGLLSFVINCCELCRRRQIEFNGETLPSGVRKLIRLAQAVPEKKEAERETARLSWLHRVGDRALRTGSGVREGLTFLGEVVMASFNLLRGRAQFRWSDTWVVMQECGPEALGVVALINFLVGLILAFVGAVQLTQFGASIYVADLVAIGTVREMGCLMTGIILSGRTGAAFAAQLGTMKVNEEIDAFKTFGISPIEFLVLPRVMALVLMMPLLCVFADAIAILGGFTTSISMLDVGSREYIDRTIQAIKLKSFLLGILKGGFFGVLVAMTGCLRGMQCGNSAAAVGQAATSAVVAGITSIIAADGIFAVICNALGI
ncbi:MAG: ABC transporter permease [Verrucomicrobiales bacterium]|nr:ABC transporter permease [Verrucomicrobiales bacterium]